MHRLQYLLHSLLLLFTVIKLVGSSGNAYITETKVRNGREQPTMELPRPLLGFRKLQVDEESDELEDSVADTRSGRSHRLTIMDLALQASVKEGIEAMAELYGKIEPEIFRNGQLLAENHPAAILSKFSAPTENTTRREMAAYAAITATKAFKKNYKQIDDLARQAHNPKISLRRTALEGLCPPRDPPICTPAAERYRTHDGTCNNQRRLRWGAAQMPFNRFLPPEYGDGVDTIRHGANNLPLSSSRFVSLLVHGAKDGDAPLTLMTAQWGQMLDHDMTSTAQPKSINGSVPSCCGGKDFHPSCFPIKVPLDDPWLAPLKVRCLEFLRSAPAQRRDCVLSWREQTNQATSFIDASPIYSSSSKSSDNARTFRKGLLIFGRGSPAEDVCQRGALARQCIRSGDGRSGEQPGLLALHQVWVGEHNRIATELSELNLHWSDEKIYQEARRIVGAMFQHITYREFLPIILGREVCKLFELDLQPTGYYDGYDPKTNPTVANSFAAAAFRFGHSLIQDSYMRCDRHHNRINNSVSLHEEFQRGDIGSAGSLHRLIRGLATQRALKRDEFISPELTNHLFQTPGFPFGLDLAAINIQRGRDHGIAPYTAWRVPCGLTPINTWNDFANIVGPESAKRIGHAYRSVHDIDLFVGGISERPVVGGLVGPTFACIIAQQFSNSRKGDRFWYENRGFESSFTPAQLHSIRRVSLAQVLCRTVGGGTFQPNIFIPHVFPGNERLPCDTGPLAPLDLAPWLEQDPFSAPLAPETAMETTVPDRVFDIITDMNSLTGTQLMKEDKNGFNNLMSTFPNPSTPQEHHMTQSAMVLQRPLNASKINDKLDFKRKSVSTKRPTPRPIKGVNNKLDQAQTSNFNIKSVNHAGRPATTTRRTVVLNNIPIELRTATTNETENTHSSNTKKEKSPTRLTTTKKKKKNKNKTTNKFKGRADNIKAEQSGANLTKPKDEDVFDDGDNLKTSKENSKPTDVTHTDLKSKITTQDKPFRNLETRNQTDNKDILMATTNTTGHETWKLNEKQSNANLTALKDVIVFNGGDVFVISTEISDVTLSRTLTDEKPLTDYQAEMSNQTENKEILTTKTQTTRLGTVENHTTTPKDTTPITAVNGTNVQETHILNETTMNLHDELTFRSNDTDKNEPIDSIQISTQKDIPETNQQLRTKPEKMNGTEYDKNLDQKDNLVTNQQFKTEPKEATVNETVTLTTRTEDITKNQTKLKQQILTTQLNTSSANQSTDPQQGPLQILKQLNNTSATQTTDPKQAPLQILKQLKEDSDIDPLTHSTATVHQRVQRKVNYSKTKTELRNVTNPKLLRVNITNQHIKLVTSFKLFSLQNRTTSTTKIPKVTKLSKTKEQSIELRQYETRPIYKRPQKVIVEGPNSDQYEIEINIRQTNKAPAMQPTLSYADYTTAFKPFGYDRYTNYADYRSTTPSYGYFQTESTIASNFVQGQRTRPPTIIYIDEHDERTTTKPSLLQNFLSFAASGFGANRRPTGPANTQKEKDKPIFSQNTLSGGVLTSTLVSGPHNSATSSQFGSEPQRQPIGSSSFSQVGSYPDNGATHAASGAVSSGNFGSIMGITNTNGADSTFSFNIRPRPPPPANSAASSLSHPVAGSYGLVPPRRPEYNQFSRPDYNNLPIASYPNEQYFVQQQTPEVSHSPFSTTGNKYPQQQSYFSRFAMDPQEKAHTANGASDPTDHKIDIHDFDYLSKTLESNVNGDDGDDDEDDSDDPDNDYQYDDIDQIDSDEPSKKFNRDGYIRPEFMIESILKNQDIPLTNVTNVTNTNNSQYLFDDNFVLPMLNNSKKTVLDIPTPMSALTADFNLTRTTTNPTDSLPKHLNNDILAEDYDDDSNGPISKPKVTALTATTTTKKAKIPILNASFVPITILTKPERPDNWVIYETPVEKPLLPEIPEIKSDTFSASEVPMPFAGFTNAWLNKYRNKIREDTHTQITTDNMTSKTTLDVTTRTTDITNRTTDITNRTTDITNRTTDIKQVDAITNHRHITDTDTDKTTMKTQVNIKTDDTTDLLEQGTARTIPSTATSDHVTTETRPERDREINIKD